MKNFHHSRQQYRIGSAAITARGFVVEALQVAQLTIKALENAENDVFLKKFAKKFVL